MCPEHLERAVLNGNTASFLMTLGSSGEERVEVGFFMVMVRGCMEFSHLTASVFPLKDKKHIHIQSFLFLRVINHAHFEGNFCRILGNTSH